MKKLNLNKIYNIEKQKFILKLNILYKIILNYITKYCNYIQ